MLALYFGLTASSAFLLPGFAIGGAFASAGILYLLSRSGAGAMALVLAGVAIASLATALTAMACRWLNPYAISEMVCGCWDRSRIGRSSISPWPRR